MPESKKLEVVKEGSSWTIYYNGILYLDQLDDDEVGMWVETALGG